MAAAIMLFLGGCAHTPILHIPAQDKEKPRKLAVLFDGTANDEGSHTNIAKLQSLITLQSNSNISAVYIEGVGTGARFVGMATGWGIGRDVREAYLYLAENFDAKRKDEIYIFGFSRGAYAARILAALLHVAGIPDLEKIPQKKRADYIDEIYDAYKSKKTFEERRKDVMKKTGTMPVSVDVEFMGIWDTVEALGWPDYKENIDLPNARYNDQLCNIRKAAHAVSLDDDRARIFTPVLLTRQHLFTDCEFKKAQFDDVVNEVWFSGAHADVGGGYGDTYIAGVSLNWMLNQIKPYNLVPKEARVYADPYGKTHDPESGLFGLIYHKMNRDITAYADGTPYNQGRLRIHRSVLDRLAQVPAQSHESHWFESDKYKHCFAKKNDSLEYLQERNCFEVVGDD